MKGYEPKEGTGWVEGTSSFGDVRRWQTPLDADTWLRVTVTSPGGVFIISRGSGNTHSVPWPGDMARIEADFGVRAWSILGVVPSLDLQARGVGGQTLHARAVGLPEHPELNP